MSPVPKGDPDMCMDDRMNFLLFLLRHQHRWHASSLGTWAIAPGCHRPQVGHVRLVTDSEITYHHVGPGLKSMFTLKSASLPDFRREAPHQVQASLRVREGGCLDPTPAISTFIVSPRTPHFTPPHHQLPAPQVHVSCLSWKISL